MSSNKRIPFTDVVTLTKDICEFIANEKYETLYVPTKDKDNKDTISVISCKENSLGKVKKDDIYQYFLSLVGFSEMERKYNRDKILTRINRK